MKYTSKQRTKFAQYIHLRTKEGWTADEIALLGCPDELHAEEELEKLVSDSGWPDEMELSDWVEFYRSYIEINPIPFTEQGAMLSDGRGEGIETLYAPGTSWKALKEFLISEKGISDSSINKIEMSSNSILRELRRFTIDGKPIKGLVYGSVQSGKTANMEALISKAADRDWNMFVVLTGTIESLRIQTRDRLERDLVDTENITWEPLELGGKDKNKLISDLNLNPPESGKSSSRYVITCLKNKSRLIKLINWLNSEPMKSGKIRLIVIDDEADQAGVNTATLLDWEEAEEFEQERKAINQLLVNLSEGRNADGSTPLHPLGAINYISYTATPFANVLNEAFEESLYPRDFIRSLEEPDEYFGLNAIFGNPDVLDESGNNLCPGLDIVRIIPADEAEQINAEHKEGSSCIPGQLKRALAWFLCSASVLRQRGYKKPITMLIHTSAKTNDHLQDYEAVKTYLTYTLRSSLMRLCEEVYHDETNRFSFDDFKTAFSRYGRLSVMNSQLPTFDEIKGELDSLFDEVSNIRIDNGKTTYSSGINLCRDNSRAIKETSEGIHIRIEYPDDETISGLEKAPVFIVFGGNTLARGLTLEGLVCTFFTRSVRQADTLLQMGRWFGYRRDYELLQRIWLTRETRAKYDALSKVEMNLKGEINRFEELGLRPKDLGIKVSSMPELAKFELTGKKKMQSAVACSFDFAGYGKDTTIFNNNPDELKENIILTETFLNELEKTIKPVEINNAVVWRGVDSSQIVELLRTFNIRGGNDGQRGDFDNLCAWIKEASGKSFDSWNVAVAGRRESPSGLWATTKGTKLRRVERTKTRETEYLDLKSLRANSDVLCDIDRKKLSPDQEKLFDTDRKRDAIAKRGLLGLSRTPLLLIYRIDCKSNKSTNEKVSIGTPVDVIGLSVIIPGDKHAGGSETAYWIKMDHNNGDIE